VMNRKEKKKLALLVSKVIDCSEILHAPSGGILFDKISESLDEDILDVLMDHMDMIKLYLVYERFNREASARDISKLMSIIRESGKGK